MGCGASTPKEPINVVAAEARTAEKVERGAETQKERGPSLAEPNADGIARNAGGSEEPHSDDPELWNIDGTEMDLNAKYKVNSSTASSSKNTALPPCSAAASPPPLRSASPAANGAAEPASQKRTGKVCRCRCSRAHRCRLTRGLSAVSQVGGQMWYLQDRAKDAIKAGNPIAGEPFNAKARSAGRSFDAGD